MSYELIATIILFGSLLGMVVILFRKIPVLVELPEVSPRKKRQKVKQNWLPGHKLQKQKGLKNGKQKYWR